MSTIPSHSSSLAAKVAARNRANNIANKLHPLLVAEAAKLLANGKSLDKADGELTAVARKAFSPILAQFEGGRVQIWISRNYASFSFTVKTWETCNGISVYEEAFGYVAENDSVNGGMKPCTPCATRRTDYDVASIEAARKALVVAKQALRDAENALCGFGEY